MATGKDIASFFENGTADQFEYCFKLYPQVLKLKAEKRCKKPQDLIRLDEWYQNELPKLIKARGKDAHMVYDELVQTMKWKQSRGKFYPQLSYLVKVNTPRAVMTETKKAFRKLPNLEQAITALSNLKGVGTTMASALLAAAAPDSAPFMADECLMAIPEIEGIDYTTKEYLNFVQHIQATVARLNTEGAGGGGGGGPFWSPHRVELALWAHYVANDLSPELLDEMPTPGQSATNGTKAKGVGAAIITAGGDDSNDADDESLGAAVRSETNNTATESETENENTMPPTTTAATAAPLNTTAAAGVLQDGDSNFVSNDSTSQEPNIDENTTQTTATSSTEGEGVGHSRSPLASDSESNLEAPKAAAVIVMKAAQHSNNAGAAAPVSNNKAGVAAAAAVAEAVVVNNGNGTLLASSGVAAAVVGGDSIDGEEDGLSDEDDDDDDDTDDDEEDELEGEESSNSRSGHKSVTPNLKRQLNDAVNANANPNTDNDSTLSSAAGVGIGIGLPPIVQQKRSLHCGSDVSGDGVAVGGAAVDDINCQPPDMKKIRSD